MSSLINLLTSGGPEEISGLVIGILVAIKGIILIILREVGKCQACKGSDKCRYTGKDLTHMRRKQTQKKRAKQLADSKKTTKPIQ